jgi:hypothetical protein
MSAADEDAVDSFLKSKQQVVKGDAAATHDPHDANVRRVLKPADPSQVSCGVRSPGAQKTQDFRLELFRGHT